MIKKHIEDRCAPIEAALGQLERKTENDSKTLHASLTRTDAEVQVLTRCLQGWSHADIQGLFTRINEHERLLTRSDGRYDAMAAAGLEEVKKRAVEDHYADLREAWPPGISPTFYEDRTMQGYDVLLDEFVRVELKNHRSADPGPSAGTQQHLEAVIRRAHKLGVDSATKGG